MRRLAPGGAIAAAGALLLFISLFLDWYEPGYSAWTVFEVWDLVLALLALAVLTAVAAEAGWWRGPVARAPVVPLAAAALVIVVVQLVNHPPAAIDRGVEVGGWLGLVGAALMVIGALLGRARISVSLAVDEPSPSPRDPVRGSPGPPRDPAVGSSRHPLGGSPRDPAAGSPRDPAVGSPRDPAVGSPPAPDEPPTTRPADPFLPRRDPPAPPLEGEDPPTLRL